VAGGLLVRLTIYTLTAAARRGVAA
jgi:hypothetical protein